MSMSENPTGTLPNLSKGALAKASALAKAGFLRSDEDDKDISVEKIQFLVLQSGNGYYGINIVETHEILKPVTVTRLPNVEPEVLGVLNLRGNIIPVIDMNKKFAGRYTELTNLSRVVVCAYQGKYMGLIVDRVVEVARIEKDSIEGTEVRGLSNQYVRGVGRTENRLFLILNLSVLIGFQTKKTSGERLEALPE